jgi:3(or 17)beta-hydroxysteroid dehydrogenase
MGRVSGKSALVTGAASGIGRATARLLAHEGARVAVTDIDVERGRTVVAEIGSSALFAELDVRDEARWSAVISEVVERFGGLDIMVNNAGVLGPSSGLAQQDPESCSLSDWRSVHEVNLDGVFLGCRHAIVAMKQRGGSIVNISSRSGLVGIPFAAPYASSKAAVRNHTKSVALYCASRGYAIRCNSIHPGAILTPMWDPLLGTGAERTGRMAALVKDTPLKRFGDPEDVAAAVLYLASDESKYVTGIELSIDGGLLAGSAASPGS